MFPCKEIYKRKDKKLYIQPSPNLIFFTPSPSHWYVFLMLTNRPRNKAWALCRANTIQRLNTKTMANTEWELETAFWNQDPEGNLVIYGIKWGICKVCHSVILHYILRDSQREGTDLQFTLLQKSQEPFQMPLRKSGGPQRYVKLGSNPHMLHSIYCSDDFRSGFCAGSKILSVFCLLHLIF